MYTAQIEDTTRNRSVESVFIQPKLKIGSTNDKFEQEADRIADQVVHGSNQTAQIQHTGSLVQRKCTACEVEELQMKPLSQRVTSLIQTKSNTSGQVASDSVSSGIQSSKGGGKSMDSSTKSYMENRFGSDFSSINIHTGHKANHLNQLINARAFTVGNDIFFNKGEYQPNSSRGKYLLAHELTHTVQQGVVQRKMIQREPASTITLGALAAKCIIGAIIGVLFDLALQYGLHLWRRGERFVVDYCSLILSAALSCIAAPIVSYGVEAWLTSRLANSAYSGIIGTLLGRILIFIGARLGMAVPKSMVGKLLKMGCISQQQNDALQAM